MLGIPACKMIVMVLGAFARSDALLVFLGGGGFRHTNERVNKETPPRFAASFPM